jgi:hypothetical protein
VRPNSEKVIGSHSSKNVSYCNVGVVTGRLGGPHNWAKTASHHHGFRHHQQCLDVSDTVRVSCSSSIADPTPVAWFWNVYHHYDAPVDGCGSVVASYSTHTPHTQRSRYLPGEMAQAQWMSRNGASPIEYSYRTKPTCYASLRLTYWCCLGAFVAFQKMAEWLIDWCV